LERQFVALVSENDFDVVQFSSWLEPNRPIEQIDLTLSDHLQRPGAEATTHAQRARSAHALDSERQIGGELSSTRPARRSVG
jgi:hypothetical protein